MKHYANCSQKGLMVIESNWKPWYISLNFNFFFFFKYTNCTHLKFYRCVGQDTIFYKFKVKGVFLQIFSLIDFQLYGDSTELVKDDYGLMFLLL